MHRLLMIVIIGLLSMPSAALEGSWKSKTTSDDFSDETTVWVYRVGAYGYDDNIVIFNFRCTEGRPVFQVQYTKFIGFANGAFDLMIRIDNNDTLRIPMRLFSNSTDDGYSADRKTLELLFGQMKAGNELLWRLDTASDRRQGSIGLNGFTKASAAFARSCNFS